jgi:hypothetical protein
MNPKIQAGFFEVTEDRRDFQNLYGLYLQGRGHGQFKSKVG